MLKGKTALVTGSTAGIGLGIARALAGEGAQIFVSGLPDDDGQAVAGSLADEFGVRTSYLCADLTEPATPGRLVEKAEQDLGPVDILVNNAGIGHMAPIEEFPPEKWDEIIAVNLSAPFHMTRLLVNRMKERGWGRIINIGSTLALIGDHSKVAYVSAKHGLVGLTKSTALETAEHGVTCNVICPFYVRKPAGEQPRTAAAQSRRASASRAGPPKNFLTVEDVGAMCVYLCSDAARSITGAALSMDWGLTAR